jgi:hypothetical protein
MWMFQNRGGGTKEAHLVILDLHPSEPSIVSLDPESRTDLSRHNKRGRYDHFAKA